MSPQVEAFRLAASLLDQAGVLWWLSDGAVLGAVREGRFLATDPDVDLGIWAKDMPSVREAFAAAGWELRRDRPGQLWAAHRKVKVDIHGHQRDGSAVWYELAKGTLAYRYPAHLFGTFAPTFLHGVPARLPHPAEEYLAVHYGQDWKTPRSRWRWDRDPPNLVRLR